MYIPDDVAVLIGFYSRERRYNGARRASLVHEGGLLSVNRPLLRIIYKLHLKRKIKPAKPAGFSFYLCLVFEREETPICTVGRFGIWLLNIQRKCKRRCKTFINLR